MQCVRCFTIVNSTLNGLCIVCHNYVNTQINPIYNNTNNSNEYNTYYTRPIHTYFNINPTSHIEENEVPMEEAESAGSDSEDIPNFNILEHITNRNVLRFNDILPNNSITNVMHRSFIESLNQNNKVPTSQRFIETLIVSTIEEDTPNEQCSICFIEYVKGEKYIKLECEHKYHEECIKKWFQMDHVCPICRKEYETNENDSYDRNDISQLNIPYSQSHVLPFTSILPSTEDEEYIDNTNEHIRNMHQYINAMSRERLRILPFTSILPSTEEEELQAAIIASLSET